MHLRAFSIQRLSLAIFVSLQIFMLPAQAQNTVQVSGELKQWHRITIKATCPESECGLVSETSDPNPFTDYRLLVTFVSPDGSEEFIIPGYYSGDGNAALSETTAGNVWLAHFAPEMTGTWSYSVAFQQGPDIVLHKDAGLPIPPHGAAGTFTVGASDKSGEDLRAKGFLRHIDQNYYYFSGTNTPFLKNGTGSPENLLYYHEISNTYQQDTLPPIPAHEFAPHIADFKEGDPLWGPGRTKGRGIMGALNYVASLGLNSYYFIVQNTALDGTGQGTGVWPWIAPDTLSRDRFSVAKLAQWEMIFTHMERLGIAMNMVTQDRINQWDLDNAELGRTRKLFYRELIARFAHHPALVWNLGEENSGTNDQIRAYSNFFREWDVYQHPIVSQANGTLDAHDRYYTPLLGFSNFDGASLQVGLKDFDDNSMQEEPGKIHNAVLKWVTASREAGRPWAVMLDEIGHWSDGVVPDGDPRDATNRRARREGFWGTIIAGADWYFGSDPFEYNDIWTEAFSHREEFFLRTREAVEMIWNTDLPFWEMVNLNEMSSREDTWVLGKPGESYFVYTPERATFLLRLPIGKYDIVWYDGLEGGDLQKGTIDSVEVVEDSVWTSIGKPIGFTQDALALVVKEPEPDRTANEDETPAIDQPALLHQNYPNPVRTNTAITFETRVPDQVVLILYDALGRKVRTITDGFLPGGIHQYELDLDDLPAGVYMYQLRVGDSISLQKMLLRL